jgi:hypothetical protein
MRGKNNRMTYALAILGIFMVIEFILRGVYLKIKNKERFRDSIEAIEYIQSDNVISPNRKFIANPYSLYWNASNRVRGGIKQTDSRGYRNSGEDITQLPIQGTLRILVLGGSTTFSDHYLSNPNDTWVASLEIQIRSIAGPGKKVEVINAGLNYATSAELLSHYIFSAQHLAPDIVIWDGPGNDFLPAAFGDKTTDYRFTRYALTFQKRRFEKQLLRSSIVKIIYMKWVTSGNLIAMEPRNFKLGSLKIHQERLQNTQADIYALNLKTMAVLCEANQSALILIDFLRPSDLKMKSYFPTVYEGLMNFNRSCNFMNSVISENYVHVHHIKLSQAPIEDDEFIDSCHLNESGELKKAIFVFENLKKLNLISEENRG